MLFDSENTHPMLVEKNKYLQTRIGSSLKYLSEKQKQIYNKQHKDHIICIDTGFEGSIYKVILSDNTTLCAKKFKSQKHYYYEYDMMRELSGIKNILFPIFVDNKNFILYYPYLEDGDLYNWIQNDKNYIMDMEDVKLFLHSISQTLLECKKRGYHHLDIKSENILIKKNESGKIISYYLIDWGLSPKMIAGTPGYLCPESLCGVYDMENAEKRDIWALGVTFFAFISKRHAYRPVQKFNFHFDVQSYNQFKQTNVRPHNRIAVKNFIKYASIATNEENIRLTRIKNDFIFFEKKDGFRPIFIANDMIHEDLVTFDDFMGYLNIGDYIIPYEQTSGYQMYFDVWENIFKKEKRKVLFTSQIKTILKGMLQINSTKRFSLADVQDSMKFLE